MWKLVLAEVVLQGGGVLTLGAFRDRSVFFVTPGGVVYTTIADWAKDRVASGDSGRTVNLAHSHAE